MWPYNVVLSLALIILLVIGSSASYCDSNTSRKRPLKTRYFSEQGRAKNVSLYWGSGPARAASALLAIILRHGLGYQHVRLQQDLLSLQHLAAKVPQNPQRKYNEVILAVSTAWEPVHAPVWVPNNGSASGLAGPRLIEYGASSVPVKHQLFVHLADNLRHREQCTNVSQLSFYTSAAALKECGFDLRDHHAVVYELLGMDNTTIAKLKVRLKALPLRFEVLRHSSIYHMLRTGSHSFLFVDYDMWSGHPNVSAVRLPPCIPEDNSTCQQETAVAMRVGDVNLLDEYAPQLLQVAHKFNPSTETIREILELENGGRHNTTEQAACEWASNHQDQIDSWIGKADMDLYDIMIFYCYDDPEFNKYNEFVQLLANYVDSIYRSFFIIHFRRFETDCSDVSYVKKYLTQYTTLGVNQRLIGAVVGGLDNIEDVVKTVDKSSVPMFFYDAPGIDADSTTSTWLTNGRTLHLALAFNHFIVSMNWTRIAVISEPTAIAEQYVLDLKRVGVFALRDHPIKNSLSPTAAETVLQNLKEENAHIILVNTNYEDAATILSAAARLKMNSAEEYAWIVRDWRPNTTTSNIQHFTISLSCLCNEDIPDNDGLPEFRRDMDEKWPNCTWPSYAAALADAVLTLIHGFKSAVLTMPQIRDDVHSNAAIQLIETNLVNASVKGVTQDLKYEYHSLKEALVYINEWHGDSHSHLMLFHVDATARTAKIKHQRRAAYLRTNPPRDGASKCIAPYGDPYLPNCNDKIWISSLIFLVLMIPTLVLAYRFLRRQLKEQRMKFYSIIMAERQKRVAALSAGYLVDRSKLLLRQELGSGRFGFVHLAVLRNPGSAPRYVAAKALRDNQDESEILREACTLASLNHPHIIRLVGVCIDKDPPLVLMEVAFFGDLLQYLRNRRYLVEAIHSNSGLANASEEVTHVSAEALTSLARQAASALGYLTLRGVIHRDLRASNCLVDASRSLKLADFGLARETVSTGADGGAEYACRRRGLFPVLWMAPESLVQGVFSAASDVWALGVLVFELVTLGERPYGDMSPLRVMEYVAAGGKPPLPRDASPQTIALARLCWQREPEQRPTAADVVAYLADQKSALRPALDCYYN